MDPPARPHPAESRENECIHAIDTSSGRGHTEFGTGKYAMRVLPMYAEGGEWGLARGYRRFAKTTILLVSGLLAALVLVPDLIEGESWSLTAMGVAVLFLPVMALVGYGAEVVQANHATVRAAVVSRLVVPGATLVGLLVWRSAVGST